MPMLDIDSPHIINTPERRTLFERLCNGRASGDKKKVTFEKAWHDWQAHVVNWRKIQRELGREIIHSGPYNEYVILNA